MEKIIFKEKFGRFKDLWSPKIVARMNDYHFKLARFKGEFVWHSHDETDETFIVLEGRMSIHTREGRVDLEEGEMVVVPKGVEHKPVAEKECKALLIEPGGTINTGDAGGRLTAEDGVWI